MFNWEWWIYTIFKPRRKNGNKTFRCKFYKDNQIKCKAFAKFDRNNTLISYNDQHSCIIDEKKIKSLKLKNEVKKINWRRKCYLWC